MLKILSGPYGVEILRKVGFSEKSASIMMTLIASNGLLYFIDDTSLTIYNCDKNAIRPSDLILDMQYFAKRRWADAAMDAGKYYAEFQFLMEI